MNLKRLISKYYEIDYKKEDQLYRGCVVSIEIADNAFKMNHTFYFAPGNLNFMVTSPVSLFISID